MSTDVYGNANGNLKEVVSADTADVGAEQCCLLVYRHGLCKDTQKSHEWRGGVMTDDRDRARDNTVMTAIWAMYRPGEMPEILRHQFSSAFADIRREAEAENARLREALTNLTACLRLIEADPNYRGIWAIGCAHGYAHGLRYAGPNWEREIEAAEQALAEGGPR